MADARTIKTRDDWTKWRDRPRDSSRTDEARKRAALWQAFSDFCRENRAWITSPPGSRVTVIETEKDSTLPQKLAQLGYIIHELPSGERLIGGGISPTTKINPRRGYGVSEPGATATMQVARYEVALPWATPPARR